MQKNTPLHNSNRSECVRTHVAHQHGSGKSVSRTSQTTKQWYINTKLSMCKYLFKVTLEKLCPYLIYRTVAFKESMTVWQQQITATFVLLVVFLPFYWSFYWWQAVSWAKMSANWWQFTTAFKKENKGIMLVEIYAQLAKQLKSDLSEKGIGKAKNTATCSNVKSKLLNPLLETKVVGFVRWRWVRDNARTCHAQTFSYVRVLGANKTERSRTPFGI